MGEWTQVLLPIVGACCAVAVSLLCGELMRLWQRRRLRQAALGDTAQNGRSASGGGGLYGRVLGYLLSTTRVDSSEEILQTAGDRRFAEKRQLAGLETQVSLGAYRLARIRIGLIGCILGCLVGLVFSEMLAVIGAVAGLTVGFLLPRWTLDSLIQKRGDELERELPQLLEVVALGLRSGLPFDRSFALYWQHFDTVFARECSSCQDQWELGLKTREQALRDLADGYESAQFRRVVDVVIRSLRFGSTLSVELEQAAAEARSVRQARRQEQVAKAPVKMMIPTGTLILPAMLLMVLGPVMLQMAGGFA